MGYKSILVHLDAGRHCPERLVTASRLALEFDAHLTGLYAAVQSELSGRAEGHRHLTEQWRALHREQAHQVCGVFREHTARAALEGAEVRVAEGDPVRAMALHGRYADLALLGQSDPHEEFGLLGVPREFPEQVIQTIGRPVLLVPFSGSFPSIGDRVIVAWDASREAARAVTDALPFLQRARQVTVMVINPETTGDHGDLPGADIALYLARHGVSVEATQAHTREVDPGSWIVSHAGNLAADLIVMGGYHHSALRESILGGVTRSILRQMTVPVLIEH